MRSPPPQGVIAEMESASKDFPPGVAYRVIWNPTEFISKSMEAVQVTLLEAIVLVVLVILVFLQSWRAAIIPVVAIPVSLIGAFAVLAGARLFAQHLVDVRPGAGDRHRRRRRHRRGRECRAQPRKGPEPARGGAAIDGRGLDRVGRDRAGAVRGVRADHVPDRPVGRILPPVRGHHLQRDPHLAAAVADPVAGAGGAAAEAQGRGADGRLAPHRCTTAGELVQPRLRSLRRLVRPGHAQADRQPAQGAARPMAA